MKTDSNTRKLSTRSLIAFAAACALAGLSAHAASVQVGGVTNAVSGQSITVPVRIDSGSTPLGGYNLEVGYNTNVVRVSNVLGGTGEFSSVPTFNTNTLGAIQFLGQNLSSLTSPTGLITVAQLSFTVVGAPGSSGNLTLGSIQLYDTDGRTNNLPVTSTSNGAVNVLAVPVALFTGTPTNGLAPLAVTFTDTSTGVITNRSWSFGDSGTTNTTATSVPHTYNSAGSNTVRLIVSGPAGSSTNIRLNYIVVTNIPAQLILAPSSRDYGTLIVAQSSNQTFSVINGGQQALTGSAAASAPFSVTAGSPFNIAGGQTGTVTVTFNPGSAGTFTNSVVFTSNAGSLTNTVTGRALTAPQLGIQPSSLGFGVLATGATAQLSFAITNGGGTTLTGTASGPGAPFSLISGTPFTVPGFSSTNLVVRFAPTAAGTFSNSVVFASNGGGSTNAITGTGAVAPAAQFSGTPTDGVAPMQVTFTDSSTGTITNRVWNFGDGSTLTTTTNIVLHTYGAAGTNTVTLIVNGPLGGSTNTKPAYITAIVYPPGDVNGDFAVGGADSLLINQVIALLRSNNSPIFAAAGYANGDVNQSGSVTGSDPLLINQVLVGLRDYVVTKTLPATREATNTPVLISIYGVGFPTNGQLTGIIGAPVNLELSNVTAVSREQIHAIVPTGGGSGTGTVSITAVSTNGVLSFGTFINP